MGRSGCLVVACHAGPSLRVYIGGLATDPVPVSFVPLLVEGQRFIAIYLLGLSVSFRFCCQLWMRHLPTLTRPRKLRVRYFAPMGQVGVLLSSFGSAHCIALRRVTVWRRHRQAMRLARYLARQEPSPSYGDRGRYLSPSRSFRRCTPYKRGVSRRSAPERAQPRSAYDIVHGFGYSDSLIPELHLQRRHQRTRPWSYLMQIF